ncbi:MAG TPA: hypothetical protein VGK59_03065 [Ohtaekwangia sp.]
MKKMFLLLVLAAVVATSANAQTLGEFKPKDQSYGLNKAKDAKRIYIADFNVNFQVYNEKEDFKQGGHQLGGGVKGDASASLSIGLEGLDEKTVLDITNKLYQEYTDKLKAKGLTIITADEAAKIESYEGYERMQGGKVSLAQLPGVMTTTPVGYEYFVKKISKDGKENKGGFLGNEAMKYAKMSKDLDDAIIGNVDITVLFVQDQNAFQGNGANIKVKTNLRIIASEGITMASDAKIKMKGQNTVTVVASTVAFYHGKMGAGATSVYTGTLAKPIAIDGVIEDTKVQSFANAGVSQGTSTIYGTFYSVQNASNKNAKVITVDAGKYSEGVYAGASKFLAFHTDAFLKELK